jgi:hypothetical protein
VETHAKNVIGSVLAEDFVEVVGGENQSQEEETTAFPKRHENCSKPRLALLRSAGRENDV